MEEQRCGSLQQLAPFKPLTYLLLGRQGHVLLQVCAHTAARVESTRGQCQGQANFPETNSDSSSKHVPAQPTQ